MIHATQSTRRSFLHRSVLALAVLVPGRSRLTYDVRASKNDHRRPSAVRANQWIDQCFRNGDDPNVVEVTDDSVTMTCTQDNGYQVTCTFTDAPDTKCRGSDQDIMHFDDVWDFVPITTVTDLGALANGGEAEYSLAFASVGGRKRRKRRGRKK